MVQIKNCLNPAELCRKEKKRNGGGVKAPFKSHKGRSQGALIKIRGVNPHTVFDEYGKTLLHVAAEYGNFPIACYSLNQYVDVNTQDDEGETPLMLAVENNHTEIITLLMNYDADIHICDNDGKSVFQVVCNMSSVHSQIIALFLHKVKQDCCYDSAKIALILVNAGCPLRHATYLHDPEVIRIMLEKGCPVDAVDSETGKTALHVAFEYASSENIKLLLEHGASIDAMDFKSRLPYFSCGMWGESDKDLEITGIILKKSALLTTSDESGIIQIGNLLHHGKEGAVLIMLRSDIDLSTRDSHGRTLMHYLALNPILANNQRLKEELRGKQFDPNARDKDGISILFNASMIGNLKLMELFAGAWGRRECHYRSQSHAAVSDHLSTGARAKEESRSSKVRGATADVRRRCLLRLLDRLNTVLLTFLSSDVILKRNENLFMADWWKRELSAPIVAQLVLFEAKGTPIIIQSIEDTIRFDSELKRRFDECRQQLEDLKKIKVYESLTLFDLLIESKEKLAIYARNEEFIDNIEAFNGNYCSSFFYSNFLNNHIQRSIKIMEARREIADIVCEVMGLTYQSNCIIIDKIIFYAMS
ncbi:ankyrin-2-like [Phymastichus coffea]|uniref:ankyrin-2-like n=1 Tax=Phymastichus coffea TaxID=108790 RepID=UPI00273B9883|nr:ankyrin-2-like [Phymastichus coffea]